MQHPLERSRINTVYVTIEVTRKLNIALEQEQTGKLRVYHFCILSFQWF